MLNLSLRLLAVVQGAVVASVSLLPLLAYAQTEAPPGEWRFYGGDPGHTKYSPLDQITKDNVDQLRIAWVWTSVDEALRADNPVIRDGRMFRTYAHEVTPLLVDGVLYTTTNLGQVAAIEPTTGDTLWSYDPGLYLEGRPAVHGFLTRGLAYWTDGEEERLFYAGGRTYLVSIDAKTGESDVDFGRNGRVDLKRGLGRTIDASQYAVSSPPVVVGATVVVGSAMTEGTGRQEAPPGHVRGYDVQTGEMKWIFHTIPEPGEFGHRYFVDVCVGNDKHSAVVRRSSIEDFRVSIKVSQYRLQSKLNICCAFRFDNPYFVFWYEVFVALGAGL